ncbi:hypothetical protein EVAR_54548_1 [Eumeta japonica]|uniref:Uncharacterized protein n=1 Tax=Eumeta variegata TaxID=151549 RepID=A0A4C1YWH6_EUMVA|nr:hypothetical protein EVAR_54548_1 [Eumeta japonica]
MPRSASTSSLPVTECALVTANVSNNRSALAAVHADASPNQVGERDAERGDRSCLFVTRSALSLALQALNGTPQSEVTPHESCFFVCAAGSIELYDVVTSKIIQNRRVYRSPLSVGSGAVVGGRRAVYDEPTIP